jgi:hypothetical protein
VADPTVGCPAEFARLATHVVGSLENPGSTLRDMTDLTKEIELIRAGHLGVIRKSGIDPGEYWRQRVKQAPTLPHVHEIELTSSAPDHPKYKARLVDVGVYALLVVAAQALLAELDGEPLDMEPEEYLESQGIKPPYSKRDMETARRAIIKGNRAANLDG